MENKAIFQLEVEVGAWQYQEVSKRSVVAWEASVMTGQSSVTPF